MEEIPMHEDSVEPEYACPEPAQADRDDSKVHLFYGQRTELASAVERFAAVLRAFAPIRKGDFDAAINEITYYRDSPCPCDKPLCEHSSLD